MREILNLLPKPSRYLGMEEGAVFPDVKNAQLHCVLAFPDMYEVGMSYLGHKIIYAQLNAIPGVLAERVFTPCREASAIMKEHNSPLASLESDTPLDQTHLLGFSITTELAFTNVLYMLDLANIPLWQQDRCGSSDDLFTYPIVLLGGGCALCAEPLAPFIDVMQIGEAEVIMPAFIDLLMKARAQKWTRTQFLEEARHIPGIYVPSLFIMNEDGSLTPKFDDYTKVLRHAVTDMNAAAYPANQVVPFGAVHNRLSLEIAKGCTRGCRFCQAGMTLRPSRERNTEAIKEILDSCLTQTGFDDVSFLSLSCGDFSGLKTMFLDAADRCAREQVSISLPSLRVGSVDGDIMARMATIRRTGATLAPEAGSQRLRDFINKGITEEELIHHVRQLIGYGWQQVKLYFMIGLPSETTEDLDGIIDLCLKVRDCCRYQDDEGRWYGPRITVTAALSPFVPKTHTPFQWAAQISKAEMHKRIFHLRDMFKQHKSLTMRWHEPNMSTLEGLLSRGDRRLAPVIEKAFKNDGIFCTWMDGFSLDPWLTAIEECNMTWEEWTRERSLDEALPWDHLESGVSKDFLLKELERAHKGSITEDCRYHACHQCGVCDTKASPSLLRSSENDPPLVTQLNFPKRDQEDLGPIPEIPLLSTTKAQVPKIAENLTKKIVRYRIWHRKMDGAAYLSQLEIQSLLDRSMRRASLPLAFSQGFHPMPLLTFGKALPVSVNSEAEWFAIILRTHLSAQEVHTLLAPHMLRGMGLIKVEALPLTGQVPEAIAERFSLESPESVAHIFEDFSNKDSILWERTNKKGKLVCRDIRPVLTNWKVEKEGETNRISMTLSWDDFYMSPLTLLEQMGIGLQGTKLTKLEQIFL